MAKRILSIIPFIMVLFLFCLEVVETTLSEQSAKHPEIVNDTILVSKTPVEGDTLILSVSVNDTNATIEWFKNDTLLLNSNDSLVFNGLTVLDTGKYIVIITNDMGSDTSEVFIIKFIDQIVNTAPVFIDTLPLLKYSIVAGDTLSINFKAEDLDTADVISYTVSTTILDSLSFFISDSSFVWVSNISDTGTYKVVIIASDGIASDTAFVTISASKGNSPPVFIDSLPKAQYAIVGGDTLSIIYKANDVDLNDSITYSILENTIADTSVIFTDSSLIWITDVSDSGEYNIIVQATDGKESDTAKINVIVAKGNHIPTITIGNLNSFDTISVNELDTIAININISDIDSSDSPKLTLPTNLPKTTIFDTTTKTLTFIPKLTETEYGKKSIYNNLEFTVSDLFTTTSFILTFIIEDKDIKPTANDDTISIFEDSSITYSVLTNDTDMSIDSISLFSVADAKNGTVKILGSSIAYTPLANFNGYDTFSYIISDISGLKDTAKVFVTVVAQNDAPVIVTPTESTTEIIAPEGSQKSITFVVSDIDGKLPNLTIYPKVPWITIIKDTVVLGNYLVAIAPTYDLTKANVDISSDYFVKAVDAEDPTISVSRILNISVTDINLTPSFTLKSTTDTIQIHSPVSYNLNPYDLDGDSLFVSFPFGKPNGVTYNEITGELNIFADRADYSPGQQLGTWIQSVAGTALQAVVTDGVLSDTVNLKVMVGTRKWTKLATIANLKNIIASDENVFYAITKEAGITKPTVVHKYTDSTLVFSTNLLDSYSELNSIRQYDDKIYVNYTMYHSASSRGSGFNMRYFTIKEDEIVLDTSEKFSDATYIRSTGSKISANKNEIVDPDKPLTSQLTDGLAIDMNSAYDNVCAFLLTSYTPSTPNYTPPVSRSLGSNGSVYSKIGANNVWKKVNSSGPYAKVTIGSNDGKVVYFLNADSTKLCMTSNGHSSSVTISETRSNISNKLVDMSFCSDSVGWVVNGAGIVYFSNNSFSAYYPKVETGLSDIKHLIVAEDRKAVYAIDNSGNVYRY